MSFLDSLAVIAAVAGIVTVYGLSQVAHHRIRRYGLLVLVWRWLSGHPLHGKPVTDAGWARPGKKALTRTGHATRWHYLPRWRRAAWRSGSTLATLASLWGLLVARTVTEVLLAAVGGLAAVWGVRRGRRAWRQRQHHRTWIAPLHVAVAPLLGIPLPNRPEDWLHIEPDRSRAVLELPDGFHGGTAKDREQLANAVAAKLALDQPEVTWALSGPAPTLTLTASVPPPDRVTLDDLRDAIGSTKHDELVLGLGRKRAPVITSLSGDSPHIGLSMGSGAGKSVTAMLLGAQVLHKGGLVVILDIKMVSHMWARDLPNACYARTVQEIHETLLWLQAELDRRNEVAWVAADVEGEIRANVGPRILVIAEELNMCQQRLKAYWRSIREKDDPTRSPAAEALDQLLFAGRQARMNVLMIGQRLSSAASGGGDARENLSVRVLGRYTAATWRMMCPELAYVPSSRHPGRVTVADHRARDCQVGILTGREAQQVALSGVVAAAPPGMPYVRGRLPDTAVPQIEDPASDLRKTQEPPVSVSPAADAISLRQAHELGIVKSRSLAGLQTARARAKRRGVFPEPIGHDGLTELYDAVQLADWDAARRS